MFPYWVFDFNSDLSEWESFQRQKLMIYVQFPLFLPRTSITRLDTHVMSLLVQQMYMQVGINSFFDSWFGFFYLLLKNDAGEELMRNWNQLLL